MNFRTVENKCMTSFLKNVRTVIKNLCLKHQGNYIAVINGINTGKHGDRNVVFNNEA